VDPLPATQQFYTKQVISLEDTFRAHTVFLIDALRTGP